MLIREIHKLLVLLFALVTFRTDTCHALEDWGGDGDFLNPFFYVHINESTGNGFFVRRGQFDSTVGGVSIQKSIDEGNNFKSFLVKDSYGDKQSLVALINADATHIDVTDSPERLKVQATNGNDDLVEYRKSSVHAVCNHSNYFWSGDVAASASRDSWNAAIGAPVPRVGVHSFSFAYDTSGDWGFELNDGDFCATGNLYGGGSSGTGATDEIDVTGYDFQSWWSSLSNLRSVTCGSDMFLLVSSFPFPYLVFHFAHMDESYVFEFQPFI